MNAKPATATTSIMMPRALPPVSFTALPVSPPALAPSRRRVSFPAVLGGPRLRAAPASAPPAVRGSKWTEKYDETSRAPYYVNPTTGEFTWTNPNVSSASAAAGGAWVGEHPPARTSRSLLSRATTAPASPAGPALVQQQPTTPQFAVFNPAASGNADDDDDYLAQ